MDHQSLINMTSTKLLQYPHPSPPSKKLNLYLCDTAWLTQPKNAEKLTSGSFTHRGRLGRKCTCRWCQLPNASVPRTEPASQNTTISCVLFILWYRFGGILVLNTEGWICILKICILYAPMKIILHTPLVLK